MSYDYTVVKILDKMFCLSTSRYSTINHSFYGWHSYVLTTNSEYSMKTFFFQNRIRQALYQNNFISFA